MRVALLLAVAGCARTAPTVTLDVGGRPIEPMTGEVVAAVGTPIRLATYWGESCGGSQGVHALGLAPREPTPCNEVHHRVHVRCTEPCLIRGPDGHPVEGELRTAPTRLGQRFEITPRASTLALALVLEAGRDKRSIPLPRIRFIVPTELVLECGRDGRFTPCERELPADPELVVRVRELNGLPLSPVLVGYTRGHLVTVRQVLSLAPGPDGRAHVEAGDYPIVVEARVGEHVLRRELTLRLR